MVSNVQVFPEGDLVTIRINGHFGFPVYRQFREAYEPAGPARQYVVDLQATDYMDSSALGMLLVLRERAGGERAQIRIVNCKPEIRRILDIARFGQLFQIA